MRDGFPWWVVGLVGFVVYKIASKPSLPITTGESSPIIAMANQQACPEGEIWNQYGGFAGGGACLPPGAVS